jgi:hypothetical protein
MKTIELSDYDYDTLMELSKEYQTQSNDGNAFPYFWEASSSKLVSNINGEGEITKVYKDSEEYTPQEFAELNEEDFNAFISDKRDYDYSYPELKCDSTDFEKIESDWIEYIEVKGLGTITTFDWVDESEHNPSLFKSDIKDFIEYNYYHLGRLPHTYARTVWRMGRMEKLISILCRMNKQENADTEIKRRVFREDEK